MAPPAAVPATSDYIDELRVRWQLGDITLAEAERELKHRAWGGARGLTYPPPDLRASEQTR